MATAADDLLVAKQVRKEFGGLIATDDIDFTIPRGSIVALIDRTARARRRSSTRSRGLRPHLGVDRLRRRRWPASRRTRSSSWASGARSRTSVSSLQMTAPRERPRRHALPEGWDSARAAYAAWSGGRSGRRACTRKGAPGLLVACRGATRSGRARPYGDQRRLEVARAPRRGPKLILLDELTAGMNPQETAAFIDFVRRMRDEKEVTVLLIEHDMKVVMGVSERITVLEYGAKIAEAPGRDPGGRARDRGILGSGAAASEREPACSRPPRPVR